MHFKFEHMSNNGNRNLTTCHDKNLSGLRRFTPSPIINEFYMSNTNQEATPYTFAKTQMYKGQRYVIATGVAHAPWDWCGPDDTGLGFDKNAPNKQSLFSYINKKDKKYLRKGGAYLLIDQSHEGYHTEWLWAWFHNNLETYNIPPKQVIYVTGNLDSKDQYDLWAKDRLPENKMLIVPYPHFETAISNILNNNISRYPSFDQHMQYKESNLDSIKTYNALQKRPRAHRAWIFKHLFDAKLLESGINSMNTFERINTTFEDNVMSENDYNDIIKKLPMLPPNTKSDGLNAFASSDCGNYLTMFNEQIMLDTWLSVVSEASFGESDYECFLSEKTFKPIACNHPFIIAGNKGSLARLRELGYKTFSPYIDESYDNLNTWERLAAITKEISRINNMKRVDKLEWYRNLKHILDFNYNLLKSRSSKSNSKYLQKIENYVNDGVI